MRLFKRQKAAESGGRTTGSSSSDEEDEGGELSSKELRFHSEATFNDSLERWFSARRARCECESLSQVRVFA